MGQLTRHSSISGRQAAAGHQSAGAESYIGAVKLPSEDENQARWQFSKASGGNSATWGRVLLNVARALGAQPAA
jgi:hypothetical protein